MRTLELNIENPSSCALLADPKNGEIKHAETYLSFYEANKLARGNANVRPPEVKKRPYKAMTETIENGPDLFHLKNRGITYICHELKYDSNKGKLIVTIPDDKEAHKTKVRFGIADGGHTYEVVTRTVETEEEYKTMEHWSMPSVRVHFIVYKDGDVGEIVEAVNTSTQVQQYTLDEYKNKFGSLKKALHTSGFDLDLVAFRENEDKEWNVVEVIQRLACFLPTRWDTIQPINMYKSKNKAVKLFTNEETREEFKEIYPVIKDVLTLPEYIQSRFSESAGKDRKVGKLNGVKSLKTPWQRPGTDFVTGHKFHMAMLLPLAAGFRKLLKYEDEQYKWATDYKKVFEYCHADLYKHLASKTSRLTNVSQIASDSEYWSGACFIVQKAMNELLSGGPVIRKAKAAAKKEEEFEEEVAAEEETE